MSSKKEIDKYQKIIRDKEWNVLKKHIPVKTSFLDVGCGSGDNMLRAKDQLQCNVKGIDPKPGEHGVGRFYEEPKHSFPIVQGIAENLPFDNKSFEVVFCSHVLEHVNDENKSLKEINRVLKDDGVLIIGMPTALMSLISYLSILFFTTHINILIFIKSIGKKESFKLFRYIFVPNSHSYPRANTIFYDFYMYRVKRWKKIIGKHFEITDTLETYLYPYPDYIQPFKIHKSKFGGSSVFFICSKK